MFKIAKIIFSLSLFLYLFSFLSCPANQTEDEIIVQLQTRPTLQNLYLTSIQTKDAGYPISYLMQLRQILQFDFNHNAITVVMEADNTKESLAQQQMQSQRFLSAPWQKLQVEYTIIPQLEGNRLSVIALCMEQAKAKKIGSITILGNIKEDRRQIHILSSMIMQSLFACESIATSRILYVAKSKKKSESLQTAAQVWEMDYDGGNAHCLTLAEKNLIVTPCYLPPKSGMRSGSFLYVSYHTGMAKIYLATMKDGVGKRMTFLRGNQLMPTVSRQRDLCAFICDVSGNPDLFLQSYDPQVGMVGKPQQIFSALNATQSSPCFSPDGKSIAFVSNKDGAPRIYVMPVLKNKEKVPAHLVKMLSKKNRESTSPAWSPDGTKIAYSARSEEMRQIWVYDFKTQQEYVCTQGEQHKENPSWAPDSIHLVFNTSSTTGAELYLLDTIHRSVTQLTQGSEDKLFPCWEPRDL